MSSIATYNNNDVELTTVNGAVASPPPSQTSDSSDSSDQTVSPHLLAHLIQAQLVLTDLQEVIAASNCIVKTDDHGIKSFVSFAEEIGKGLIAQANQAYQNYTDAIAKQAAAEKHYRKFKLISIIVGAFATVAMAALSICTMGASLALVPALLPVIFGILTMIPVDSDGTTIIACAEDKLSSKIGSQIGAALILGFAVALLSCGFGAGAAVSCTAQTLLAAGLPSEIATAEGGPQWVQVLYTTFWSITLVALTCGGSMAATAGSITEGSKAFATLKTALFISQVVANLGSAGFEAASAKALLDASQPTYDASIATALITQILSQMSTNDSLGKSVQDTINSILNGINEELHSISEGADLGLRKAAEMAV